MKSSKKKKRKEMKGGKGWKSGNVDILIGGHVVRRSL